jgi:ATP-binding cassette subfamily B protein
MLERQADRLLVRAGRQGLSSFIVLMLATIVSTGALLLFPLVLAEAVDTVLEGQGPGQALARLGAVLATAVIAEALTHVADSYCTGAATAWLRHGLLQHVLALGVSRQRRFAAGDLISRLVGNAPEAAGAAPLMIYSGVSMIGSIGGVIALGLIDWRLAVTFLLGTPIGLVLIRMFVRHASELITRYQEIQGGIAARLMDALSGVRTIRAAGTVLQEIERVLAPVLELAESGYAMWRTWGQVTWQLSLLASLMQIATLGVAGYGVVAGRISPGHMLAAVGYVTLGLGFFEQSTILMRLARSRAGARRAAEVLAERQMVYGADQLPAGSGELVFSEVTIRVGNTLLLDRLHLTVPAGTAVAIVGASGAGKSTIAALAGRLIDPDEGQVLLDGVPLTAVEPGVLRREISYAFDRPALLGGTVADAIGYGSAPKSRAKVEHAARTAQVDEFITRLPAGYETPLRETPLSGGEAQRLGLARAVAHGGRLLVLDDATSSLDTVTEMQVTVALAEALSGRTRLVIAHRTATAARANQVAWLDAGRIRALAPHHVLWDDPDYRAVFRSESKTGRSSHA